MSRNGIFCLEGDWWGRLKRTKQSSVKPRLELPNRYHFGNVPFIHRDVAASPELVRYLEK
jgi:hypothetical protein